MSFIFKFFKTVRNHWKKSIVFSGISVYGVHYAKGLYEDDLLRRQYCAEARKYGEEPLKLGGKARKVTVFLNPAASRGGGKKLFEKNAAPLLYLAGLEVNVIKTEYEGQIKEYLKVFEQKHADAIIVAGGNVSVLELVTGMMRKDDQGFRQKTPIGIIPVGSTNKFATFFYGPDKTAVRRSLDIAMSIVKGVTKNVDVLKIQGEESTATYALCGMESGAYRDAKERTSKYWYFGPLKHRFTYLRTTLRTWPPKVKGLLEYAPLTEENAQPKSKPLPIPTEKPKQSWTWKSMLFGGNRPMKKVTQDEIEEEEYDFNEGDEIIQKDIEVVELNMNSGFIGGDKKLRGVELELGPSNLNKSEFISEGWSRIKEPIWKTGSNSNEKIIAKKVKFTPEIPEGKELWFNIDGEQFEAKPIAVTLLKDRLKMFTEIQPAMENR